MKKEYSTPFKKDLKNILILDVKTTCWEYKTPIGQMNEIIKLGICTLNINEEKRITKETILVKPENSSISTFCSKVTGLYPKDLQNAISFQEACEYLNERYMSKSRVWATYGCYGRTIFQKQCRLNKVPYPFSNNHINVKNLLALVLKLNSEVKLEKAFEILELPYSLEEANLNESWYIATVLGCILNYEKFLNLI